MSFQGVSTNKDLLEVIDQKIVGKGFLNRSDFIRYAIRKTLESLE